MRIAGIIAEYNPFHRGHAHHIRQTRALSGCDYVVVCMAGNFTQRGEAACLDKWSRAEMALRCGADAVFELPALWTLRPADAFARGGVAILGALGCDVLSFGSEQADLPLLERMAELREAEPKPLAEAIRSGLNQGLSHARARGEALAQYLGIEADALNRPNLILGVEYLRSIRALEMPMVALAVPRIGAYHGTELGEWACASAIRAALADGRMEQALECVPEEIRFLLRRAPRMHQGDDLLLYVLRNMTEEQLRALPDVAEGLEKRVKNAAARSANREELMNLLKCKRYTFARLSRLCIHALLGITDALCRSHPLPEYARLTGLRMASAPLMRELKARSRLPIAADPTALRGDPVFELECRATDLRALLCSDSLQRRAGQELTQPFVRLE